MSATIATMKGATEMKPYPIGDARSNLSSKSGSALLLVICLSFILLMAVGTMLKMSSQQAYTVSRYSRRSTALSIAEAGIADMLKKLASNFDAYKMATIANSFNDGEYTVTSVTNGRTGAILTSKATYLGVTRITSVETFGVWQSAWDTNMFGAFGIISGGLVDGNGQGTLNGNVYTGDNIELAPGTTINGDAYAVGEINNQGTITGSVNSNAVPQEVPHLDPDYYRNLAINFVYSNNFGSCYMANDVVINYDTGTLGAGDIYIDPDTNPNAGCVIFVEGNVTIKNGGRVTGCIAAMGEINMLGGDIVHAALTDPISGKTLPSLMAWGYDVNVRNGQTLNGLIYAEGNVTLNGGVIVYGGVIAHGIVDARNDWVIWPGDSVIPPGIMPAEGGSVLSVRIGAWLK